MRNQLRCLLILLGFVSVQCVQAQSLEQELQLLDEALDMAESYVTSRNIRVVTIENQLLSRGVSLEQQYNIYGELYDANFTYQYDKAQDLLNKQREIANRLGHRSKITDVLIKQAMLYTSSGMFLEAREVLHHELDTLNLSPRAQVEYYNAQMRFCRDYTEYAPKVAEEQHLTAAARYYRRLIIALTPPSSEMHQWTQIQNCLAEQDFRRADQLNRQLLSLFTPHTHTYAIYAYTQATICEELFMEDEALSWYARSALADIKCATKDNASMSCLAQRLLNRGQVERAFRYIKFSLNDALFYNAKLRPWQISRVLPAIEDSYNEIRAVHEKRNRQLLWVISLLSVGLLGICCWLLFLYQRRYKMHQKIASLNEQIRRSNASLTEMNEQFKLLNRDLMEANTVKEEYIGLFLSMCSNYIDKMHHLQRNVRRQLKAGQVETLKSEFESSKLIDNELRDFYEVFDNAFLQLYPNFVQAFNLLLKEDQQIRLKEDEQLNTELRIFALIRLGINDSSRIASLLRYSVNTIYNYRARIKNCAKGNRDEFEHKVKQIGIE